MDRVTFIIYIIYFKYARWWSVRETDKHIVRKGANILSGRRRLSDKDDRGRDPREARSTTWPSHKSAVNVSFYHFRNHGTFWVSSDFSSTSSIPLCSCMSWAGQWSISFWKCGSRLSKLCLTGGKKIWPRCFSPFYNTSLLWTVFLVISTERRV